MSDQRGTLVKENFDFYRLLPGKSFVFYQKVKRFFVRRSLFTLDSICDKKTVKAENEGKGEVKKKNKAKNRRIV